MLDREASEITLLLPIFNTLAHGLLLQRNGKIKQGKEA
jgi:hypothetical protein